MNSQFYGKYTQLQGYKINRFPKKNYEVDYTCISSIHYKTSHIQSAIKSLGLVLKFLGKFPITSVTQLFVYCEQQKCF